MVTIPTKFSPPSVDYEKHLDITPSDNIYKIFGSIVGIEIYANKARWPDFKEIRKHTPEITFHNHFGYSVGLYHEFFINALPNNYSFVLGKADISFGEVTPMGIYLFDNYHDKWVHGESWESVNSIRMFGVYVDVAEAYLLNAIFKYRSRFRFKPELLILKPHWWEDSNNQNSDSENVNSYVEEETSPRFPPASIDIEPLRCFYHAIQESDNTSACVHFYKIIEFYAFFELQKEFSSMRHDHALSDRECLIKAAALMTREEKGPIIRLIVKLASPDIVKKAVSLNLLDKADPGILGSRLYDFRNSIVHAKYDHRASLVVDSVLEEVSLTTVWREIFEELALLAINQLGRKDV